MKNYFIIIVSLTLITIGSLTLFLRFISEPDSGKRVLADSIEETQIFAQQLKHNSNEINEQLNKNRYDITQLRYLLEHRKRKILERISDDPTILVQAFDEGEKIRLQLPPAVKNLVEQKVEIEGKIEISHFDNFKSKTSKTLYKLSNDSGDKTELFFLNVPPTLVTNMHVRVNGIKLENKMLVLPKNGQEVEIHKSRDGVLASTTVKKIAVIMYNFLDNAQQPFTAEQIRQELFVKTKSVNTYLSEVSYGTTHLEGHFHPDADIYGWYTIPYLSAAPATCEISGPWQEAAINQAAASGFDVNNYTTLLFVLPAINNCTYGIAGATLGGSPGIIWTQGEIDSFVLIHEFGHTLSLNHANAYLCKNVFGTPVAIDGSCMSEEYGDPFDEMGWIHGLHFSTYHRLKANFSDALHFQNITSSGSYTLEPAETSSQNVKTLVIPRKLGVNQQVPDYYYLEFRQPFGIFDTFLTGDPVINGVSIRIGKPTTTSQSLLIDTTPETATFSDAALAVGKTFTDSTEGVTISTLAITPQQATVEINLFERTCKHNPPTLNIYPNVIWVTPGTSVTYSWYVTNNDSSICPASNFILSASVPPGFTFNFPINRLMLYPGQKYGIGFSVTSPTTITESVYNLHFTATNENFPEIYNTILAQYNNLNAVNPSPSPLLCATDYNHDGVFTTADLLIFIPNLYVQFYTTPNADITQDGLVNIIDFGHIFKNVSYGCQ